MIRTLALLLLFLLVSALALAAPPRVEAAGLYTLRYAVQPANGYHMGVSAYRDFFLLIPAAADPGPGTVLPAEDLIRLARKSTGSLDVSRAAEAVDRAIDEMAAAPPDPSLFSGFTGLAWVLDHLRGWFFDENDDPGEEIAVTVQLAPPHVASVAAALAFR